MFLNKNSIIVNNISLGQYITKAEYQFNKLWGEDSGRNMAGEQSGTFLGVFPKIIVTFKKLNKAEMEIITPIIDSPYQTLTYYDPTKRANVTMSTYTGDYNYTNEGMINNSCKNSSFSISFIAVSRRA